jgi:RecA-family ATPase
MEPTELFSKITEMVGDIKPTLIGIASSANVFAGNEIDRSQVQQFVTSLTRLAILARGSVVLISHPSLTGINTGTGLSGSTQWHNAVRARFYLKGLKEEEGEPKGTKRVIEFFKNQYGPLSENIVVEYRNGLYVPVENTTVDQEVHHQHAEEAYLDALKVLIDQNQDLHPSQTSTNYAPKKIKSLPRTSSFTLKDMEAAQQRLLNANKIHIADIGHPSKPKKTIRLGPDPNRAQGQDQDMEAL